MSESSLPRKMKLTHKLQQLPLSRVTVFLWLGKKKSKMASQGGLKEVVSLYQTLIKEWNRKPVDLEKVGKLLSGMKVSFYFSFHPLTELELKRKVPDVEMYSLCGLELKFCKLLE